MSNSASFIVTKTDVLWSGTSESHDDIVAEHGLRSDADRRPDWVCVEMLAPYCDFRRPPAEWEYRRVGDAPIPDWYDVKRDEARVRESLLGWIDKKVVLTPRQQVISGHVRAVYADVRTIGGSAHIESVRGGATVMRVAGSARIDHVGESATIYYVGGHAYIACVASGTITRVIDHAHISHVSGTTRIFHVGGHARIGEAFEQASIANLMSFSRIEYVGSCATVGRVDDYAHIAVVGGSAKIGDVSEHGSIGEISGCAQIGRVFGCGQIGNIGGAARIGALSGACTIATYAPDALPQILMAIDAKAHSVVVIDRSRSTPRCYVGPQANNRGG